MKKLTAKLKQIAKRYAIVKVEVNGSNRDPVFKRIYVLGIKVYYLQNLNRQWWSCNPDQSLEGYRP